MKKLVLLLAAATMVVSLSAQPSSSGYHVAKKLPISGEARWDYITVNPISRRLYVTHGTKVDVLNADTGESVGEVSNTPGVHGVALAPDLGKGFTSNGKADTVSVFDLETLKHTAEIKVGKKPDAIVYDAALRRVFVSDGDSDELTAIDAETGKVLANIPLGGAPEYIAVDGKGSLWVNIEDKGAFVSVDAKALTVKKTTPLPGCTDPGAMAFNPATRRLFIGCAGNRTLVIVDADQGNIVAKLPIGDHVDATAFDPDSSLIFASTGDGHVTIVHEDSPDKYTVVDTVATMRGAKTMALDSKTKRIFLPTAEGVPSTMTGGPGPAGGPRFYVPGAFVVLVVEK